MISLLVTGAVLLGLQEKGEPPLPPHAVARLGSNAGLHGTGIGCLAPSPDGEVVVTAGGDRRIRLWDPESARLLLSTAPQPGSINSLSFSPDGRTFATSISDGVTRIWTRKGAGLAMRSFEGFKKWSRVLLAFSPDGRSLIAASKRGEFLTWDVETGTLTRRTRADIGAPSVYALSPSGQRFAWGDQEGIHLVDPETGKAVRTLPQRGTALERITFSPDERLIATLRVGRTVAIWDLEKGQLLYRIVGPPSSPTSLAFSHDGNALACGDYEGQVRVWKIDGPERIVQYKGHSRVVTLLAFSKDGSVLYSGGGDQKLSVTRIPEGVEILRGPDGRKQGVVRHTMAVRALAVSPDGRMLASASDDLTVRRWSLPEGRPMGSPATFMHKPTAVRFSPDGKTLAVAVTDTAGSGSAVHQTDAGSGQKRIRIRCAGHPLSLAWSPEGTFLAAGCRNSTATVWKINSRTNPRTFNAKLGRMWGIAFSPDGRLLAGSKGTIPLLWDFAEGHESLRLEGHGRGISSIAFSPDGRSLVTGSYDYTVRLWDLATGQEKWRLHHGGNTVNSVAFSPDGRLVLSGGDDGTVRLIDATSGKQVLSYGGHTGPVYAVTFLRDGRHAVSGSKDASILIWSVP